MRDPREEHESKMRALQEAREAAKARAAENAAAILKTDAGRELFEYLARKFHLRGRAFMSASHDSPACPYAAASRDGERAVINHVFDLARTINPEVPIP